MTRADVVRRVTAVGLVSLAAAAVYIRLFGFAPVVLRLFPAVVLCCVGYAIGTAGGRRVQRGMGALVGLIAAVLATIILGAMTIPGETGRIAVSNFMDGVVRGLGILLGSVVPAPVNAQTVTFTILLVTYGALVACMLATTPLPASSLAPPIIVFIIGLALSQGSTVSALPFAGLLVVSVVIALALLPEAKQSNRIEDGAEFASVEKVARPGRALRATLVAVIAVGIAAASVIIGPSSQVGSLRPAFDPHKKENFRPDTDLDGDDIVSLATKWQTVQRDNQQPMFDIAGPEIPRSVNWAINAKFDGVRWSSLTTFDQVGPDGIPDPESNPRLSTTGTTSFATSSELPGPWLPATYRPTNVYGVPARADREGTVVAGDDKGADKRYSVDFRALAVPSLSPLLKAEPEEQPEYGTLRELPNDFPVELQYFAATAMSYAATPYEKLQALADATSGTGYREQIDSVRNGLDNASLTDVVLLSKAGTQAQYATAFAMMARSQGFPTRLVVGYAVSGKRPRTVMSTDVIVYPEVQMTRVGWVPFAPGPRDMQRGVPVVRVVRQPEPEKPEPAPTTTATPEPTPEKPQTTDTAPTRLPLVLALAVLLALGAWPLVAVRRRRTVRETYRRGSPDQQIVGAWSYLRAARRRLGQPLDDTWSPARYVVGEDTDPDLASLAALAEAAMYAPEAMQARQAQHAWQLCDSLITTSLRAASRSHRLRWHLWPGIPAHAEVGPLAQVPVSN